MPKARDQRDYCIECEETIWNQQKQAHDQTKQAVQLTDKITEIRYIMRLKGTKKNFILRKIRRILMANVKLVKETIAKYFTSQEIKVVTLIRQTRKLDCLKEQENLIRLKVQKNGLSKSTIDYLKEQENLVLSKEQENCSVQKNKKIRFFWSFAWEEATFTVSSFLESSRLSCLILWFFYRFWEKGRKNIKSDIKISNAILRDKVGTFGHIRKHNRNELRKLDSFRKEIHLYDYKVVP
ncbi:2472_t:CDS:2 [Funneliformis mosseae]|uniref:2472_t:CDS:1 n=1 Tax=Funneliformis mosseae TaxID=27381 RepID=A0A9N9D5T6_FUNMO|nr:2472_t:CDS:2 [Funneliformis mosseae]